MGLFTTRPENEGDAWAALPGEPFDPTVSTPPIGDSPPTDALGRGAGSHSISIDLGAVTDATASDPADEAVELPPV